jgi:glucan phosphoethanolaminetransferase (alkaline phosphatase superfamily)
MKSYISYFTAIATAILVIVTIDAATSSYESVSKYLSLDILVAAAVTALITTIISCREIKTRRQFLILFPVHFLLLCASMIGLGLLFGWIDASFGDILSMVFYVALVYVIVFAINYILAKKEADALNEALDKRRESSTHSSVEKKD